MCIRDRRYTAQSASWYNVYCWFCVFGTGAIPFCVFVQRILLPPIYHDAGTGAILFNLRLSTVCVAGFVYSGQMQYHSVFLYSVYCFLQYITMQDWLCLFGTDAMPVCVLVQCVLLVLCIRDRRSTILS